VKKFEITIFVFQPDLIFFRNETKKIDLDNFVIGSYPVFEQFGVVALFEWQVCRDGRKY